jgi:hypothetical protein
MYNVTLKRFRAIIFEVDKVISIIYSEIVFVPLCIQHAILMSEIVTCSLLGSTVFFHIIS